MTGLGGGKRAMRKPGTRALLNPIDGIFGKGCGNNKETSVNSYSVMYVIIETNPRRTQTALLVLVPHSSDSRRQLEVGLGQTDGK